MAAEQTILFTVMPRAVSEDGGTLPVSVFVTPRLRGEHRLGAYGDWLTWTRRLKEKGLTLELRSGGRSLDLAIDPDPLRLDLWEALFDADTLVRSHTFDDYSDRAVLSYPVREALSALKSIYQEAGVRLALPASGAGRDRYGNRGRLRDLVRGLEVHWSPDEGDRWRAQLRDAAGGGRLFAARPAAAQLDREGLVVSEPDPGRNRAVALPFSVFHHMPTPPHDKLDPDWSTELDFHQALASLNAYPALQRALGIVFDLELPPDFVSFTDGSPFEMLSVGAVHGSWDWSIPPTVPELSTACVHLELGDSKSIFLTAPRALTDPSAPSQVIGLLNLDPVRFGLAQVDVDGAMHKAIMLAETWHDPDPGRNLSPDAAPEPAPHPEVFDPEATLPALRSGGLTLYADGRASQLLDAISQSKAFNDALESTGGQSRPFFAEDLVRGYRLDVWDSRTARWHSLHRRQAEYSVHESSLAVDPEEGFIQLAATQPAKGAKPETDDLYLHEAIARWAGWSLSVQMPGKSLSRYADPHKAVPPDEDDPEYRVDQPETPFKLTTSYRVVPGSLPRLRFGSSYRVRARAVDLAGNSLELDGHITDGLATVMALPNDPEGFTYLRYEPVIAPLVVPRDPNALTGAGSALDRLVIRTFNAAEADDAVAADATAADRHILPPRTSVEMGERLGMFDTAAGELDSDPTTWKLVADRDAGELAHKSVDVAGKTSDHPLEPAARIDALPYLPDPLARGAAIRDLPGTPSGTVGHAEPGAGAPGSVGYTALKDPNPRPESATIVGFAGAGAGDWERTAGFRLELADPKAGVADDPPSWDPVNRTLTVHLPKGHMTTVPLTSFVRAADLTLMGAWQWLREYLDRIAVTQPQQERLRPLSDVDRVAHVLQRAVEGGHWMLTPPRLLTLVHAVQQPIGRPEFTALSVQHDPKLGGWDADPLQTEPSEGRADPTELAPITAWRRPGATEAYLMGALRVHGASTSKLDLEAAWEDLVDDPSQPKWTVAHHEAHADELPLQDLSEHYLVAGGKDYRAVGYYDPEHDQIAFVRTGDWIGARGWTERDLDNAAPRHVLGDTKHHRVTYTAIATSRYREYFPQDVKGGFTRPSAPVVVDVPASARPLAPSIVYVVPTFGWQRQVDTNLMRSVRFGGGLRVYLHRPWFSSGEGELLGVALWSSENGKLDRDAFKPFISQWGMDPIWETGDVSGVPHVGSFPDAVAHDYAVTLEEPISPGPINVVGFEPEYDESRGLWFADLTLETPGEAYAPFVRLALVRYQPNALLDAKVSRVVLADFAQLAPDRAATVTCDPYHPQRFNVAVSGVAPRGPAPGPDARPTEVRVRLQERDPSLRSDLAWGEVAEGVASVETTADGPVADEPDLELWAATVTFADRPKPGRFRLLVEEHELIHANYVIREDRAVERPGRLIYAEAFELDHALVRP